MCIAILKTKDGNITDEALRTSFEHNKDGAGIAYTVNEKLIIEKGIFNIDEFITKVRNAEKIADNNILIHCRIGTSGLKDANNTHPFLIHEDSCLIHNGILDIDVPKGSTKNDTQLFIEQYLKCFSTSDLLNHIGLIKLIEKVIDSNKFVIMDNKGNYRIFNEKEGHWNNGVWYSNESYKTFKFVNTTNYMYGWGYKYDEDDFDEKERNATEDYFYLFDLIDSYDLDDFIQLGINPFIEPQYLYLSYMQEDNSMIRLKDYDADLYDYYFEMYQEAIKMIEVEA